MTKREVLKSVGSAAALPLVAGSGAAGAERPNIVIILADDMGYGDAGCFGSRDLRTPHIDRLAETGMRWTDFHSSGNVCSPTRAGLLTGRYQQRAGIPGVINADPKVAAHHLGLRTSEVTFAGLLKGAGYATGIFGKWHLGYTRNFNPVHHGFDRFRGFVSGNIDYHSHYDRMGTYDWWEGLEQVEEEGYSTHLITKHALQFIEQHKHQPFCLYIAHEAVHSPWQGPGDPALRGPGKHKGRGGAPKERAFPEMMEEMDKGIGEVVETLKRLDLEQRTFVFFFSDNGPAGGSAGPLRGRKGHNWEGGHRVPAVAWWPGRIEPGTVCDELGISLDLLPTMLAIAGVSAPDGHPLDGVNLLPTLTQKARLGDRKLFWNGKAMRHGPWKLILDGKGSPGVGLYNLSEDLGEQRNLAAEHPERVETMLAELEMWKEDVTCQPGKEKE